MNYKAFFQFGLIIFLVHYTGLLKAQVLPVGTPVLEDYYRRAQLVGKLDSTISFAVRPLSIQEQQHLYFPEIDSKATFQEKIFSFQNDEGSIQLLPLINQLRYTSGFPIGWNDAGMIPATGWQNALSFGVFAKYKWLSIQIRPEFITAENRSFQGFNGQTEASWELWYKYANTIDMPERFGNRSYTKLLPGQSSVRINLDPVSFGLSTENLWWGPGVRNSLLMSNTAPGFFHFTLNTNQPVHTPVGSFEGQLVAGRLTNSGFSPTPLGNAAKYDQYYEEKPDDWRYISGFILSYQPKWLTGLSIGASRSFVINSNDLGNGLGDILPFFGARKISSPYAEGGQQTGEQHKKRDEYKSVFARWVMPKGKLEFYVEYGRNDPGWNARDRFVEMDHTRGYIFGFKKLLPLGGASEAFIDLGFELAQVDGSRTSTIRGSQSWYTSNNVRAGYTNLGQMLGAGIGPGGTLQHFDVAWVRGLKRLGLQLERQEHQLDFFYEAVVTQQDFRRNWVDVSAKVDGSFDYKRFLFFGDLWFMKALNYQYDLEDLYENPRGDDYWNFNRRDKFNFQANIGVMYRF